MSSSFKLVRQTDRRPSERHNGRESGVGLGGFGFSSLAVGRIATGTEPISFGSALSTRRLITLPRVAK